MIDPVVLFVAAVLIMFAAALFMPRGIVKKQRKDRRRE